MKTSLIGIVLIASVWSACRSLPQNGPERDSSSEELHLFLKQAGFDKRIMAARLLGERRYTKSIPDMLEILDLDVYDVEGTDRDHYEDLHREIFIALGNMDAREQAPRILAHLKKRYPGQDKAVQGAARALVRLEYSKAVPEFRKLYASSSLRQWRSILPLLEALGAMENDKAALSEYRKLLELPPARLSAGSKADVMLSACRIPHKQYQKLCLANLKIWLMDKQSEYLQGYALKQSAAFPEQTRYAYYGMLLSSRYPGVVEQTLLLLGKSRAAGTVPKIRKIAFNPKTPVNTYGHTLRALAVLDKNSIKLLQRELEKHLAYFYRKPVKNYESAFRRTSMVVSAIVLTEDKGVLPWLKSMQKKHKERMVAAENAVAARGHGPHGRTLTETTIAFNRMNDILEGAIRDLQHQ
jgi:hypothetical protein